MRKLSFALLMFAAIIVFTTALPLDNENGPNENSVGLKGVEKNRLSRKPPGKVPGPKLIQEPHITTAVKFEEFERNQFGTVALEDMNEKSFLLFSGGNKDGLGSLSSDYKKQMDKKDLTNAEV